MTGHGLTQADPRGESEGMCGVREMVAMSLAGWNWLELR